MSPRTARPVAGPAPSLQGFLGRDLVYALVLALQLVSSLAVTPILTRVLGASEFGQVALGIATSQVVWAVADLGLAVSVQLEYAAHGDLAARRRLTQSLALSTAVVAVVVLTEPWWVAATRLEAFATAIQLGCVLGLLMALMGGGTALLRSRRQIRRFAVVVSVQMVGGQVLGLLAVEFVASDARTFLTATAIGYAAGLVLLLLWARPTTNGLLSEPRVVGAALAVAVPLVPQQLAEFVLSAGDRAVIGGLLGPVAVGRYQAAYALGSLPLVFLIYLNKAWLPRVLAIADPALRWATLIALRRQVLALLLPALLGLALGAPLLLRLWVPADYRPGSLALVLVVVATGVLAAAHSWASVQMLISLRRTLGIAITTALAAAVNVGLNLVLVPRLDLLGSALATVAAGLLLAAANALLVRRAGHRDASSSPGYALAGATTACVVACLWSLLLPLTPGWLVIRGAGVLACASLGAAMLLRTRTGVRDG